MCVCMCMCVHVRVRVCLSWLHLCLICLVFNWNSECEIWWWHHSDEEHSLSWWPYIKGLRSASRKGMNTHMYMHMYVYVCTYARTCIHGSCPGHGTLLCSTTPPPHPTGTFWSPAPDTLADSTLHQWRRAGRPSSGAGSSCHSADTASSWLFSSFCLLAIVCVSVVGLIMWPCTLMMVLSK